VSVEEFTKRLTAIGYAFVVANGAVEVTRGNVDLGSLTTLPENTTFSNGGYVYLDSLTTLPENTTFSNGGNVYLPNLTTLPENTTFSNRGYVYLRSLTTLPENTTFSNGGNVDLRSLTTLPENTTFSNGSYVYLRSLTTLPENTTFSNGGNVDLRSLTSETQTYRGKTIRLRTIDGYTMLILSSRKLGEATVSRARYFGGGDIAKLKACYVASQGKFNAHGDTAGQALRDLRFKVMQEDFDCDDLIAIIKRRGTVEFNDFRLITCACESGLRHGMTECGLDPDASELPLETVLAKAHGSFGAAFKRHFAEAIA
jgi:hypothetical protein